MLTIHYEDGSVRIIRPTADFYEGSERSVVERVSTIALDCGKPRGLELTDQMGRSIYKRQWIIREEKKAEPFIAISVDGKKPKNEKELKRLLRNRHKNQPFGGFYAKFTT